MSDTQPPPHSPTLGTALRSIRKERGWSLAETSAQTGVAIATLSKVENGKRTLTYDKLLQLARALDVDISRLFSEHTVAANQSTAAGRRSVQGTQDGFVIEAGVYTYTYLAHDLMLKRFSPVLMDLHARSIDEFEHLLRHGGEEHAYVLEGEVILHTDIYAPLRLTKGESVYFNSGMGHAYLNAGDGPARILCIASTAEPQIDTGELPVAKQAGPISEQPSRKPAARNKRGSRPSKV